MNLPPYAEPGALVGEGLACRRGGRLVFAGLSCRVEPGGVLLLTGANGSGKSSLLRVLATLLRPESGRLEWRGVPVRQDLPRYRAALHYVGHLDALKPAMTARETLAVAAALRGGGGAAPDAALAALGLGEAAAWPCRWLSAGQRKRVALARLLVAAAPLWLLDEPTAGLDAASEARLTELIAAHRAAGGCAVVTTHLALAIADAETLSLDSFAAEAEAADTDPWAAGF